MGLLASLSLECIMKLQNVTLVVLAKQDNKTTVKFVVESPLVAVDPATRKPVFGPLARRLMTVGEIALARGLSKNKASEERRANPLAYLAEFPVHSYTAAA